MNIKDHSGEFSDGNEKQEKGNWKLKSAAILVTEWQRTRLNCAPVFYEVEF